MTKFIKVIDYHDTILLLNVDRIEHICVGSKGTDTFVRLLDNRTATNGVAKENYFFVKESVEDIWNMINDIRIEK